MPWYFAPAYMSVVLMFSGLLLRDWRGTLAASVILADWAICTELAGVMGSQFEWSFMALTDCAAAWVLMLAAGRREMVIAGMFALQVIAHLSFAMVQHGDAEKWYYWWALFWISCGQCAFLGWGLFNGGGKKRRVANRPRNRVSRRAQTAVHIQQSRRSGR